MLTQVFWIFRKFERLLCLALRKLQLPLKECLFAETWQTTGSNVWEGSFELRNFDILCEYLTVIPSSAK